MCDTGYQGGFCESCGAEYAACLDRTCRFLPIDVDNESTGTSSLFASVASVWLVSQSFTATSDGLVQGIDVYPISLGDATLTYRLHAGAGTAGLVLSSGSVPAVTGTLRLDLDPVSLSAGSQYTIAIDLSQPWQFELQPYAGGAGGLSENGTPIVFDFDLAFRTRYLACP